MRNFIYWKIKFNTLFERLDTATPTSFIVGYGSLLILKDNSYTSLFSFLISRFEVFERVHNADVLLDQ